MKASRGHDPSRPVLPRLSIAASTLPIPLYSNGLLSRAGIVKGNKQKAMVIAVNMLSSAHLLPFH